MSFNDDSDGIVYLLTTVQMVRQKSESLARFLATGRPSDPTKTLVVLKAQQALIEEFVQSLENGLTTVESYNIPERGSIVVRAADLLPGDVFSIATQPYEVTSVEVPVGVVESDIEVCLERVSLDDGFFLTIFANPHMQIELIARKKT